jgi:RNA polymerase sigma factor (sigma-70 family)
MRSRPCDNVLHHIRGLVAARQPGELLDRELLERFVTGHDEAAFAAIVERHGPLVLSVCRRILRSEHHAEDACQSTFLVLARKAGAIRKREALASWLYGVASRVARKLAADVQRRASHDVRDADVPLPDPTGEITWREGLAVLDEELQRLPKTYRSALVLCYLEGRTQDEAARELGCSAGALCGRLVRARECLRGRLTRRGVGLPAALLGTLLVSTHATAALPATLALRTVQAAAALLTGQALARVVPAHVATLTQGVLTAMLVTRAKMVAALVLTAGLLASAAGALAAAAGGEKQPPPNAAVPPAPQQGKQAPPADKAVKEALTVRGRVLDSDGKPVAGAGVYQGSAQRGVSDAQGQFQVTVSPTAFPVQIAAAAVGFGLGWIQVPKPQGAGEVMLQLVRDEPITGRVVDPEGRPVAGATLRPVILAATRAEDLSAWLRAVAGRKANSLYDGEHFTKTLTGAVPGLPQAVTTDRDGRFRLAGVGRERLLIATVGAPKYQFDMIGIMTRRADKFQVTDEWKLTQSVYGARFEHVLAPSRAITGTVRDLDTGKPMAGVHIVPEGAHDYHSPDATIDKDGKYRIDSLPGYYSQQRAPNVGGPLLMAFARGNDPYLRVLRGISFDRPRVEPLVIDFHMKRGIWVSVKVKNKATGEPIAGAHVEYYPFRNNPHTAGLSDMSFGWMPYLESHRTGSDGVARVPALPGPGLVGAGVDDSSAFLRVEPLAPKESSAVFSGIFHFGDMPNVLQGIVRIDPPKEGKSPTYAVTLDPGRTLTCTLTGPDGTPLTGCRLFNAVPNVWASWSKEPLAGSDFTLRHLPAGKPYSLIALHPAKKLVRLLELKGDEKGPLSVKLEPAGTVTGRLLDPDGKPMPRRKITIDFELPTGGGLLSYFPAKVTTDATGRFRIEGLAPGIPYFVLLGDPPLFVGEVTRLKVRPGESRDLGEVKYKPLPQNPGGRP